MQRTPLQSYKRLFKKALVVSEIIDDLFTERVGRPFERHFTFVDQVDAADIDRIKAQPMCDGIHHALAHKCALEAAGGPICRSWGLVGEPEMAQSAICRDLIRAGQHAGRHIRDARSVRADIRTLGVKKLVFQREYYPALIGRYAHTMKLFAGMVGRNQMLAPVFDPFDWPPEPQSRKTSENVFRIEFATNTEPSASMAFEQVYRGRAAFQDLRQEIAGPMRYLCGAVHLENIAYGIEARDNTPGLQRHPGVTAYLQLEVDDCVRVAKAGLHVTKTFVDDCRFGRVA